MTRTRQYGTACLEVRHETTVSHFVSAIAAIWRGTGKVHLNDGQKMKDSLKKKKCRQDTVEDEKALPFKQDISQQNKTMPLQHIMCED